MSASEQVIDVITRRLLDIEQHQMSGLRSSQTNDAMTEAAGSIRDDLTSVERDLEELQMLVEEGDGKPTDIQRIQIRLSTLRAAFREAHLQTKRSIDTQNAASRRADLFKGSKAAKSAVSSSASGEDTLMTATSDVTDGLRRTMQLMQQELDRSVLSNQLLEESSGNLQETGEQYSTFSNILTASKNLIVSLERADIIDRFLITAALVVFGLVCLYIIKRRVLDKGIRVAGLLGKLVPTKAFSKRAADSVAAGSVRTNSLEETITAVTATATAAATLLSSSLSVTASNILSTSARQSSSSSSSQTSSLLSRVSSSTVSAESATPRPKAPQASTLASESPVIQPPDSVVDEPEPAPPSEPSITRSSAAQPMQEEAPDPVAEAHPLSASTTLTSTTADTIETFDVDTSSSTTVESSIDVLHSTLSVSLPIEEAPAVLDDLDDGEIIPTQHMTQIKEQLVDMGVLDRTEADAHFVDPTHVEHQQHQKHDEL